MSQRLGRDLTLLSACDPRLKLYLCIILSHMRSFFFVEYLQLGHNLFQAMTYFFERKLWGVPHSNCIKKNITRRNTYKKERGGSRSWEKELQFISSHDLTRFTSSGLKLPNLVLLMHFFALFPVGAGQTCCCSPSTSTLCIRASVFSAREYTCGALVPRVHQTGGNRSGLTGYRSNRSGPVPVSAGTQSAKIQTLNLNSKIEKFPKNS